MDTAPVDSVPEEPNAIESVQSARSIKRPARPRYLDPDVLSPHLDPALKKDEKKELPRMGW